MAEWHLRLDGDMAALGWLARELNEPALSVKRDAQGFYVNSTVFGADEKAIPTKASVEALIAKLNELVDRQLGSHAAITIASLEFVRDDATRIRVGFIAPITAGAPTSSAAIVIRTEAQRNPVADEVSALTAVVRPILEATLYALKQDLVADLGGHAAVTLKMLARLYRPGDGDCGLCFEWAIHDAMNRKEPLVVERVVDAISKCRVRGSVPASILFGAEKTGALKLIDTAEGVLTEDSRVLAGDVGQPVKLRRYIRLIAAAFRRPDVRLALPYSIQGIWKADLFVGTRDYDRWVGTSVKINAAQLESARGLRIGIVPSRQGRSDKIYKDDQKNMVVCPIPHDGAFMQVFYEAWGIVQQFIAADAYVPKEVALPRPAWRQVARYLEDRRDYAVLEVIEALRPLAQPELLSTSTREAMLVDDRVGGYTVGAIIAPVPKIE